MPVRNLIVIALTAVVSLACYAVATKNRYANLFAEAISVVEEQALQDVPRKELFKGAMDGMMSQLDKHSMYVSDEFFQALDEDMNQQFGGVGMYVDKDPNSGKLIVLAPIPNTPAFEAGVRIGDEIYDIEGQQTQAIDRADAIKLMRGPRGSIVNVTLRRGEEFIPVSLKRADIPVPSVHGDWRNADGTWNYVLEDQPRIGYIRLLQFGKKSTEEVEAVLGELNGNVDGLIFDLRNNSGGLLTAAIDICDMFLDRSLPVVRTRGRNRVLLDEHFCTAPPVFDTKTPIVLLINRHSASASEIVAGCLQDHGRAVVIGEQSWGKGTVQNLIPIERNRSALKLTVASFWRPSDRNIDRYAEGAQESGVWGIQPNEGFAIEMTEEQVFGNIRRRNERDLSGFRTDTGEPQHTENGPDASETSIEDLDLPLERAKQYFKDLFSKAIAA